MNYSIGEVSEITGLSISTLHYYDREGMFPLMARSEGGIRLFSETEVEALHLIKCLKRTGMSIKDIKQFLDWCQEGDVSLPKRRDMFYERLEVANQQLKDIESTIDTIKFKCQYYDAALSAGTENGLKNSSQEESQESLKRAQQLRQEVKS